MTNLKGHFSFFFPFCLQHIDNFLISDFPTANPRWRIEEIYGAGRATN